MTVIVTVECPDQPVKVLVREKHPFPQSDTAHWVYRNEKQSFSVYEGKALDIEEWPEGKRPSDRTDQRLEERLARGDATDADVGEAAEEFDRDANAEKAVDDEDHSAEGRQATEG